MIKKNIYFKQVLAHNNGISHGCCKCKRFICAFLCESSKLFRLDITYKTVSLKLQANKLIYFIFCSKVIGRNN